jgi:hypothetical protein
MGFTLFRSNAVRKAQAKAPYDDDQAFGRKVGRIDIKCTLKADTSHWTKSTNCHGDVDVTGLLHFNIRYNDNGRVPLSWAKVQIDIGKDVNGKDVNEHKFIPTFKTCAPLSAVTGRSIEQHIIDTKKTDPQAKIATPYGGLEVSGRLHELIKEFDVRHGWFFVAENCSYGKDTLVTRTNFIWMRTLLEDNTGSTRSYDGAIVLHRKSEQPLVLRVGVEAQPWKWQHHVRCPKPQDSYPIQPRKESLLKPEHFAKLQESLQERVAARNRDLGNTGKPPDKALDHIPLILWQKYQSFG